MTAAGVDDEFTPACRVAGAAAAIHQSEALAAATAAAATVGGASTVTSALWSLLY
jgi:hypothetical protein